MNFAENELIWKQLARKLNKTVKSKHYINSFKQISMVGFHFYRIIILSLIHWRGEILLQTEFLVLREFIHQWYLNGLFFIDCIQIAGGSVKKTFILF